MAHARPLAALVPKITDFGLAKRLEEEARLTQSGLVVGTPSYMAPEQADATRAIGPAADLWALGAVLCACLTGRPPFLGESPAKTLMQVLRDEPVPPSRLQPGVPRDLETICLKCLEKEPRGAMRRPGTSRMTCGASCEESRSAPGRRNRGKSPGNGRGASRPPRRCWPSFCCWRSSACRP